MPSVWAGVAAPPGGGRGAARAEGAAVIWTEGGEALWTHPFADDALAVIVHPAAPLDNLSLTDLREVLRGRVGEWPDGTPIQVVVREEGAGTRLLMEAVVLGDWDFTLTARVVAGDESMLRLVAGTPGAIGFVPLSRLVGEVRVLALEGRPPAPMADYPLSYSCLWAAPAEPAGPLRDWIQWTIGPQGQAVADKALRPGP